MWTSCVSFDPYQCSSPKILHNLVLHGYDDKYVTNLIVNIYNKSITVSFFSIKSNKTEASHPCSSTTTTTTTKKKKIITKNGPKFENSQLAYIANLDASKRNILQNA